VDKWLRNKIVLRVFSLLLGILLWAIVQYDMQGTTERTTSATTAERTISNVAIHFVGLDNNAYSILSTSNKHVTIKLRGTQKVIKKYNVSDGNSRIVADLTNVGSGKRKVFLEARGYPDDVDVVIEPNYIMMDIEQLAEKEMPVLFKIEGTPVDGYDVQTSSSDVSSVLVSGIKSNVDKVTAVVAKVNITNATDVIAVPVTLVAQDKNGATVKVEIKPGSIQAKVQLVKRSVSDHTSVEPSPTIQ
jgi:YbbR domain-containing protein